jgi:hypothetical protein
MSRWCISSGSRRRSPVDLSVRPDQVALSVLSQAAARAAAGGGVVDAVRAEVAGAHRFDGRGVPALRRQVREVVCQIFGVPISTGAVDASIMRMSEVLADPWEQLRASVQAACQVHADQTGWRLRGAYECLWVATTALAACYRIDPTPSQQAAKDLLGEELGGFVICDRCVGYHWFDVLQQQLCRAHAIRQLIAVSERRGAPGKLGKNLLAAARAVIKAHRAYLEEDHDLDWLRQQPAPLREQIQTLLQKGARGRDQKTANFSTSMAH